MPARRTPLSQSTAVRDAARPIASAPSRPTSQSHDFVRWRKDSAPRWHPIRKMRYVFWRMSHGAMIRDAIREIHWADIDFWEQIGLDRDGPFRMELKRARLLQSRALADSVLAIAEGRDAISVKERKKLRRIITKGVRRAQRATSSVMAKRIIAQLLDSAKDYETRIIARNKLQIEAAKWLAEVINPVDYGRRSSLAIGAPGETGEPNQPLQIQFVGPDGKVVSL